MQNYMCHSSRSSLPLTALTFFALAFAGCSSSPGSSGGVKHPDSGVADTGTGMMGNPDAGGNGNPDSGTMMMGGFDSLSVATTLAQAQCSFFMRCVPAYFSASHDDMNACVSGQRDALKSTYDFYTPALNAGRLRYQSEKVNACVSELATVDCDLGQADDNPCAQILVGTVAVNSACELTGECAPGSFCQRMNGFGSCGVCTAVAARGATCGTNGLPCAAGSVCANVGTAMMPVGQCVPDDAAEHAPCGSAATGICRGALQCVGTMAPGVCTRPAAANAMCDPMAAATPDCDLGKDLICDNGTCKQATWSAAGGPCGSGTNVCDNNSFCEMGATMCTALPGAGSPCAGGAGGYCGADTYCDANAQCAAVKPSGAACTASAECQGDLSCLGASGAAMCGTFNWMQCN